MKMTKPGDRPITLPMHKGRDYAPGLPRVCRKKRACADSAYHAEAHYKGSYWAEVRELPGCFASGNDLNELREALDEAVGTCLPWWDKLVNALTLRTPAIELERELVA
jgi:hypothetical protein